MSYLVALQEETSPASETLFTDNLITSANADQGTVGKIVNIMSSSLRDELMRWVKFGVGMDLFAVTLMNELVSFITASNHVNRLS